MCLFYVRLRCLRCPRRLPIDQFPYFLWVFQQTWSSQVFRLFLCMWSPLKHEARLSSLRLKCSNTLSPASTHDLLAGVWEKMPADRAVAPDSPPLCVSHVITRNIITYACASITVCSPQRLSITLWCFIYQFKALIASGMSCTWLIKAFRVYGEKKHMAVLK